MENYIDDYKELIELMKENKFIGTYKYEEIKSEGYKTICTDGLIIWRISTEVSLKIIIGGHGGDDYVGYYINIDGVQHFLWDEDFNTRDNKILIEYLKEINDNESYVVTWKSFWRIKTELILPYQKDKIYGKKLNSEYKKNSTIYKFGKNCNE